MSEMQDDGNGNDDVKEINSYHNDNQHKETQICQICQIYSRKDNNWYYGEIVDILIDPITNKRWFNVSYKNNTKTKKIQKFSKNLRLFNRNYTIRLISNDSNYNSDDNELALLPLTGHIAERKELFLSGYFETHSIKLIPFVVERLMDKHIGDHTLGICNLFTINISGHSLIEFLSAENGKPISNIYPIKMSYALNMECKIYPNGKDLTQRGSVIFSFKATTNIHDIDSIRYYVNIQCKEISFEWKQVAINEIEIDNSLFIKQCKNKKRLTFNVYVEIINVHYVYIHNFQLFYEDQYFMEPFRMNSYIEYEWIINKNLLAAFRSCNNNQYYFSPNFERYCMSIYCIPKESISNTFRFGLRVYRIPHDVDYFVANITFIISIECTEINNKVIEKDVHVHDYKMVIGTNVEQECCNVSSEIINIARKMTIMVKIDIIKSC